MIKVKCNNCDSEMYDTDNFCRYCGNDAPERDTFECPECGEEVFMEDNFCFNCGTKFEGMEEADDDSDAYEDDAAEDDEQDYEDEGDEDCQGQEADIPHNPANDPLPHNDPRPPEPQPDPAKPWSPQ